MKTSTVDKSKKTSEYLRECFIISIDYTVYWKARPASHFGVDGLLQKRDDFNKEFAGRAVGKGPDFTGQRVAINGIEVLLLDVVKAILLLDVVKAIID